MTVKKQKIAVEIRCSLCHRPVELEVYEDDLADYQNIHRTKHIQDIFPYLTCGEREILISGICEECFANIFKDE